MKKNFVLLPVVLLLLFSSCDLFKYTPEKASRKMMKAYAFYPEVVAKNCNDWMPLKINPDSISIDTTPKPLTYATINFDSLLIEYQAGRWPPNKIIYTDTGKMDKKGALRSASGPGRNSPIYLNIPCPPCPPDTSHYRTIENTRRIKELEGELKNQTSRADKAEQQHDGDKRVKRNLWITIAVMGLILIVGIIISLRKLFF